MKLVLDVMVCDFCGAIHGNEESATEHGCNQIPNPDWQVGDEICPILAIEIDLGGGAVQLSTTRIKSRVVAVLQATDIEKHDWRDLSHVRLHKMPTHLGGGTLLTGHGLTLSPQGEHEWWYEIEPLEDPAIPKSRVVQKYVRESNTHRRVT